MKQKNLRRMPCVFRLLSLLAAVVLLVSVPVGVLDFDTIAATQSDYDALKKKQDELKKQQDELKKQIAAAGNSIEEQKKVLSGIRLQISNVEEQLELQQQRVQLLDNVVAAKNSEIAKMEQEIADKQTQQREQFEKLQQRLRWLSKVGNLSYIQMLFDTDDYADYLIKSKLIENISKSDQQLIESLGKEMDEIQAKKDKVEQQKQLLSATRGEMEDLLADIDAQKMELDNLYVEAKKLEKELESKLDGYEEKQKELEAETKRLEKEMDAILKELQENDQTVLPSGSMYWPAPTVKKISSYFGIRWGKLHGGIDIANGKAAGEPIVAALDGTVVYANYTSTRGGGYGYYCMVNHGKDKNGKQIVTLYAHMSRLDARVGDVVKGGQTKLGVIGSTGNSTGPHLHFEVRVNGTKVDPLDGYVSVPK